MVEGEHYLLALVRCIDKVANIIHGFADFLGRKTKIFANCSATAKINKNKIHAKEHICLCVGNNSLIDGNVFFEKNNASVIIGERTFIGASLFSCAEKIHIGNDVLISFGVVITDHDSHAVDFIYRQNDVQLWARGEKDWTYVKTGPVIINDKVWIGMNAIILEGVTIGEGAVVGAGSVVTKDVHPWTVVAGNPARVIRTLTPPNCAV